MRSCKVSVAFPQAGELKYLCYLFDQREHDFSLTGGAGETKVDPIYFERSYCVTPDSGAEKGYALLLAAMRTEECLWDCPNRYASSGAHLILRPSEDYLVAYTIIREHWWLSP